MANIAPESAGGNYKPVPAGNHVGVCSMVVGLGKQNVQSQMYGDSVKHQIYLAWELPHEQVTWTDKDGNEKTGPMRIGKTYTFSMHEKARLRGDLESWRGKAFSDEEARGFDINRLAGAPCMVNVLHEERNGKTYANIASLTPLPKGMDKPVCSDAALIYDDDEFRHNYDHLPEWLQKKIDAQVREEPKPTNSRHVQLEEGELDDAIPF